MSIKDRTANAGNTGFKMCKNVADRQLHISAESLKAALRLRAYRILNAGLISFLTLGHEINA
jgi:hypothetical protein